MMAWLVSPTKRWCPIVEICATGGTKVYTQHEINTVFVEYYEGLYSRPTELATTVVTDFLDSLPIRSVSSEIAEGLGSPIVEQELKTVTKRMAQARLQV